MKTMMWMALGAAVLATGLGTGGCNKECEGDSDGDCDEGADDPHSGGGSTGSGGSASGGAGGGATTDPRCSPDGGFVDNACDTCENSACCATRFACYDDSTCDSANNDFDACLEAPGADPQKCWDTFVASGPVAKARRDCQFANCKTECGTL